MGRRRQSRVGDVVADINRGGGTRDPANVLVQAGAFGACVSCVSRPLTPSLPLSLAPSLPPMHLRVWSASDQEGGCMHV